MAKTNSKQNYLTKMGRHKSLSLFLTCLPPLLLICFVVKYAVNLPFADEWYFVPLFEKMFNHSLSFRDLWVQHNEHRFLITRLVTLANVKLTGWNLKYEIYLNISLGVATFASILAFLYRKAIGTSKFSVFWIFPSLSLIFFSLNQSWNWLWGIQVNIFLNVLFVLIGIIKLSSALNWQSVFTAGLMGIFATYSNATGLLYWPIALVVIYFNPASPKKLRIKIFAAWIITAILVYVSYFFDYRQPDYVYQLTKEQSEISFIQNFLAILGSPLEIFSKKVASFLGILGISIYIYSINLIAKKILKLNSLTLTLVGLSLYAISYALIVGTGRLKFNLTQVQLTFRYGYTIELFWIAIIIFSFAYANQALTENHKISLSFNRFTITFIIIALISMLAIKSSIQALPLAIERQNLLSNTQKRLLSSPDMSEKLTTLAEVYPRQNIGSLNNIVNLKDLANALDTLSRHNLSTF